ncbi:hypothetical protein [Rhizobium leguminosarum]|uniref:hypothetical protein n=1 Tax=Rhizobium leguminosarum TaxID=384 RepID=UPI000480DFC8|nr:hypothetical protein [Rhizobium leguminosarum]
MARLKSTLFIALLAVVGVIAFTLGYVLGVLLVAFYIFLRLLPYVVLAAAVLLILYLFGVQFP